MPRSWFVLWCEDDTSYSLVDDTAVICEDDSIAEGDEVKFFYKNKECVGIVKGMDDDYDALKAKQDKLNAANKKRDASFHEGRKRVAAERSRANIAQFAHSLGRGNKQSSKAEQGPEVLSKKAKSAVLSTGEGISKKSQISKHGKGIYSSSEGSDNELSEKEKVLLAKIKEKESKWKKQQDLKLLQQNTAKKSLAGSVGEESESSPEAENVVVADQNKSASPKRRAADSDNTVNKATKSLASSVGEESESSPEAENVVVADQNKSASPKRRAADSDNTVNKATKSLAGNVGEESESSSETENVLVAEQNKSASPKRRANDSHESDSEGPSAAEPKRKIRRSVPPYEGIMYRYDDPELEADRDALFQEILGEKDPKTKLPLQTGVFVTKKAAADARKYAKAATQYARKLIVGVFTKEALEKCTISGDWFKARGRANMVQKPALDGKGVVAIISAALIRQGKKSWAGLDAAAVKASLRQKLVDMRPRPRRN